jgi:hypothetical protein
MQFRVHTDEQILLWQRVGLVITAESERELEEILNEPPLFQKAMAAGKIEYTGHVEPYWETEEHQDWEHDAPAIDIIKENENA